jgi:peptidase M50B-like protein
MPQIGGDSLTTQFDPNASLVLATGLGALAAVTIDGVWRWSRSVVTIVHEAGHALVALLTGRRLDGIRLHADTSGLTLSSGRPRGPGMVLTAAAGYPSPSMVGLAGVALLAADQVTIMLWAGAAVLALMLIMIRNLYGALLLLVVGGAVVYVSLEAAGDVQAGFAYAMTWFLLLGSVRPVVELWRMRRRPGVSTDAHILAGLTRIPAGFWVTVFGTIAVGALGAGAWLLLQ